MADKPEAMLRNGRPRLPINESEALYRRVSPEDWGEPHPDIDALDIPDMSVNRGRPIGEPEWVLLEDDEHSEWGIVSFLVADIPREMTHSDGTIFTFRAEHVPLDQNYPHAEVWAFKDGMRAQARKEFDRDLSMRWRNKLLQRTKRYRRPGEFELD